MTVKWLSPVLAALFCAVGISAAGAPVTYAEETAGWIDQADTAWYDDTDPQPNYTLHTEEELAGLAKLTQDGVKFEGVDFVLAADLDLAGAVWTPIDRFYGNFDGGNHVIRNLQVRGDSGGMYGLFGLVIGSTLQNIGLLDVDVEIIRGPGIDGEIDAGTLVGQINNGLVKNAYASGKLTVDTGDDCQSSIGGLVGFNYAKDRGTVSQCSSSVVVTSRSSDTTREQNQVAGGVVGWNCSEGSGVAVIENCAFTGTLIDAYEDVYYASYVGGIAGVNIPFDTGAQAIVTNSVVTGTIQSSGNDKTFVGAIATQANEGSHVERCYYDASIPYDGVTNDNEYADVTMEATEKTAEEMSTQAFVDLLNEGQDTPVWGVFKGGAPVPVGQLPVMPADYADVEAAKQTVPADLSIYTDESVQVLNAALAAVEEGKMADEQALVDRWAADIESAVGSLVNKASVTTAAATTATTAATTAADVTTTVQTTTAATRSTASETSAAVRTTQPDIPSAATGTASAVTMLAVAAAAAGVVFLSRRRRG